ncbi:phosphatase PAP2 family protein [Mucilaginibacter gynuensis]|uniref:Phosphatase PAP2 family protein n=1 Tax=Mucilaginibacter gynuensis TaxID=1302236 RepID=A0ABP8FMD6_9SPHI
MRVLIKWRLAFILITASCFGYKQTGAQGLDLRILKAINPSEPTSQYWIQTSNSIYWAGAAIPVADLVYGFAKDNEDIKHDAYEMLISVATNIIVTDLIKRGIDRDRPGDKHPDVIFPNSITHGKSFPSGHTSLAFAEATTFAFQYKRWWVTIPAYAWATSVAYSRMYLGKHYPSDVLGGAAVGIGSALASRWLNRQLFKPYYKKKPTYDQ